MRSRQFIVTSSNSPFTLPLNPRGGRTGFAAIPNSATYTVEFTLTPLREGLAINTLAISNMTSATTNQQTGIGPVTALIITLDSGTSVTIDIAQSDV